MAKPVGDRMTVFGDTWWVMLAGAAAMVMGLLMIAIRLGWTRIVPDGPASADWLWGGVWLAAGALALLIPRWTVLDGPSKTISFRRMFVRWGSARKFDEFATVRIRREKTGKHATYPVTLVGPESLELSSGGSYPAARRTAERAAAMMRIKLVDSTDAGVRTIREADELDESVATAMRKGKRSFKRSAQPAASSVTVEERSGGPAYLLPRSWIFGCIIGALGAGVWGWVTLLEGIGAELAVAYRVGIGAGCFILITALVAGRRTEIRVADGALRTGSRFGPVRIPHAAIPLAELEEFEFERYNGLMARSDKTTISISVGGPAGEADDKWLYGELAAAIKAES